MKIFRFGVVPSGLRPSFSCARVLQMLAKVFSSVFQTKSGPLPQNTMIQSHHLAPFVSPEYLYIGIHGSGSSFKIIDEHYHVASPRTIAHHSLLSLQRRLFSKGMHASWTPTMQAYTLYPTKMRSIVASCKLPRNGI
jgi:hypothetical protein